MVYPPSSVFVVSGWIDHFFYKINGRKLIRELPPKWDLSRTIKTFILFVNGNLETFGVFLCPGRLYVNQ